jgi:PRTRC genetic system ThiF family protein
MSYTLRIEGVGRNGGPRGRARTNHDFLATVTVVGCGGTGGFLADAVCRLLMATRSQVYLVDMDRAEQHNVARQAFEAGDIGRFKAEVLAERLSRRYGRDIAYSVQPYSPGLHRRIFGDCSSALRLVIGAVDNSAARRSIATGLESGATSYYGGFLGREYWLDCGNMRNSGQVLLGNQVDPSRLKGMFVAGVDEVEALPAPSLQRPDLLLATPQPVREVELDCAERMIAGDQSRTINQLMAAHAVSLLEHLIEGTCRWMGCYIDGDMGTVRYIPIEPATVAASIGRSPRFVTARAGPGQTPAPCPDCGRVHGMAA